MKYTEKQKLEMLGELKSFGFEKFGQSMAKKNIEEARRVKEMAQAVIVIEKYLTEK